MWQKGGGVCKCWHWLTKEVGGVRDVLKLAGWQRGQRWSGPPHNFCTVPINTGNIHYLSWHINDLHGINTAFSMLFVFAHAELILLRKIQKIWQKTLKENGFCRTHENCILQVFILVFVYPYKSDVSFNLLMIKFKNVWMNEPPCKNMIHVLLFLVVSSSLHFQTKLWIHQSSVGRPHQNPAAGAGVGAWTGARA